MDQPEGPDHPDRDARRRVAEAAARAAEERAAVAAAEAKAAIAAAARAAAAADAAARAAEEAVAQVARQFGGPPRGAPARSPDASAAAATQPVPVAPRPAAPRPAPVSAARAGPAGGAVPDGADGPRRPADPAPPDESEPITTALPTTDPPTAAPPTAAPPTAAPPTAAPPTAAPPTAPTTALPPVGPGRPDSDGARAARAAAGAAASGSAAAGGGAPQLADATRPAPARHARSQGAEPGGRADDTDRGTTGSGRRRLREPEGTGPPTRASRRAGTDPATGPDPATDPDPAGRTVPAGRADPGRGRRVIAPRRTLRVPALVAAGAAGLLVLGAVAVSTGIVGRPPPAAVVDTAVPTLPGAQPVGAPAAPAADPAAGPVSNRGVVFLARLREAGVPTSRVGTAEVEAADLVCDQLAGGAEPGPLSRSLTASLPTVSRSQAAELIAVAQEHYCE